MKATMTATTLTVSWNCKNLAMESYTLRPHITAFTIDEKLSSVRMMSDASFATSVPAIPWGKNWGVRKSFNMFCVCNSGRCDGYIFIKDV